MRRVIAILLVAAGARAERPPRLILTPSLLAAAERRARAGTPEWKALAARCDDALGGAVEWPDGNNWPNGGRVGAGYQGDGYRVAVADLGVCFQVGRRVGARHAEAWGRKGVEVLVRMSEPAGPHAPEPRHDSGYGVRNYGVGMALGYDWLHDLLTVDERARVFRALDRWIDSYERDGFGRDHPQGNYFAGYYAAKALAALATDGENPRAAAEWDDWLARVHRGTVQPYYARHLAGGGWPEGWTYGPLATANMAWPLLAAKSARGIDLLHDPAAPYAFPVEQARHLVHFTWPSRRTVDDRGAHHGGPELAEAPAGLIATLAGLLEITGDPFAPQFHRWAREVRGVRPERGDAWQELLFWDRDAPEADYRALPRSFVAAGMQAAALRSDWDADAVWASFTAGTYVGNPDSGEMGFDQGALVIVHGGRPLLANPAPLLIRYTPGTQDGDPVEQRIYNDGFGNNELDPALGNRTLANVFYARARRFGQIAAMPDQAATRLGAVEDAGAYVLLRGEKLEEMYRTPRHERRPVARWTRDVLYLRPSLFVVWDRTTAARDDVDQWLAFHLAGAPRAVGGRYQVVAGDGNRGVVTPLLPAGHADAVIDVFDRHRVWRLEVRPGRPAATQRWLTVLDAVDDPARSPRAEPLAVEAGEVAGVLLRAATSRVALFPVADPGAAPPRELRYRTGPEPTEHVLVGMAPGRRYAVTVAPLPGGRLIRVTPGDGPAATAAGVLRFTVASDGALATR